MWRTPCPPSRFALLVCLIHQAQISTRDQIVEMFIKRMSKLTAKAKEELERLREEDHTTTERLIEVFTDVLQTNTEADSAEKAGTSIRKVLDDADGICSPFLPMAPILARTRWHAISKGFSPQTRLSTSITATSP
jgi:hypothetical protein